MENFDATTHLDESGSFNDQFYSDLPEELQGNEFIKRAGSVGNLIKVAADTKSAYDKKMENVIQRPGDDADDATREAFRTSLLTEAGYTAPETVDGYELIAPEGIVPDEEGIKEFKEFCKANNMPAATAKAVFDMRMGQIQAEAKADEDAYQESATKLKTDWAGDRLLVNLRCAHDALMQFGSDDVLHNGENIKGVKTLLTDAKLYESPSDLTKWRELGLTPDQLRLWSNIGQRMQSGTFAKGSPNSISSEQKKAAEHRQAINAANAKTPQFQV